MVFFSAVPPVMPELLTAGVEVICTRQHDILRDPRRLRAGLQGLWNFQAARRMEQALDGLDPRATVVHVHSWTKALSASVVRRALNRNFPVLFTLHDYFWTCPNGGLFNYKNNLPCRLKPMSFGCLKENCDVRSYPQKLWRVCRQVVQGRLGRLQTGVANFISVSHFSEAILRPYLAKRARIWRVPNPVEAPRLEMPDIRQNQAFVAVGRLSREKGTQLFAVAARDLRYPAVFVGEGACRQELQTIYSAAIITGWLPKTQVLEHLRQARALVFPSLCYETSGLAVAEAAALGVPAIVPHTAAARELVEDGVTGLWFKSGDVEDLKAKMQLLADGSFARELGRQAYQRFWEAPSGLKQHLPRLERVYREILDNPEISAASQAAS
jgi:glycosyltransferase involved in cell wall biosynthesis